MKITIKTRNGREVTAPAERWLCGLVALLNEQEFNRLAELVADRVELGGPSGHVIGVPGIVSAEKFGKV